MRKSTVEEIVGFDTSAAGNLKICTTTNNKAFLTIYTLSYLMDTMQQEEIFVSQ